MNAASPVRRPVAWRIHPDDAALYAEERQHCETRRCRNPVAVVTWRYYRSPGAGLVLVAEHLVCDEDGQEFADRHHVQIGPPPAEPTCGHGKRNYPEGGSPS